MMAKMLRIITMFAALAAGVLLTGCGTSTTGPMGGSLEQTRTGVNGNGYPDGKAADTHSPALASSSEAQHSRDQDEEKKAGK